MPIELQDKLYTSAQVADILGVSLRTLYRYMEDGRIKSMRTASGRHRFTKEHIVEFLDAGKYDPEIRRDLNPEHIRDAFDNLPSDNFSDDRRAPAQPQRGPEAYETQRMDRAEPIAPAYPSNQNYQANNSDSDFSFYNNRQRDDYPADNVRTYAPPAPRAMPEADMPLRPQAPQIPPVPSSSWQPVRPLKDTAFDDEEDVFEFDQSAAPAQTPERRPERPLERPMPQDDRYSTQPRQMTPPVSPYIERPRVNQPAVSYPDRQREFSTVEPEERVQSPVLPDLNIRYYKSEFTDLIELAKKIKETTISRDLEYAFTLYAGLSLHFLINPFTILHYYVNPEDIQVWKNDLRLVPGKDQSDSNIGILINTDVVFMPTREIGGFRVVEDKLLLRDLMKTKDEELIRRFRQRLSSL